MCNYQQYFCYTMAFNFIGEGNWNIQRKPMSEWVSCLMPIQQLFSYIMARTVNFQWDNNVACLVLDQNSQLDFYSASSLKQQSADRHVTPLGVLSLIHKTIHVFILLWKHKRQIKRQKEATVPPLNNTTTMVFISVTSKFFKKSFVE